MIDREIRILIVEDSMTDAALLQRQLQKLFSNPEISVTDSLKNMRYTAKTFVPELIFSDFNLGTFTGVEVMKEMKDIFPEIPIIIVTGTLEQEEYHANAMLEAASGFFLKKNMSELAERMEPYLEKIIKNKAIELERLRKKQEQVEKLSRLHTTLKEASKLDPAKADPKKLEYYKKIFQEMNDNMETFFN